MMVKALTQAPTEHTVYFLLTSYLAARAHRVSRTPLPAVLTRFPIRGEADVSERLSILRSHMAAPRPLRDDSAALADAIQVFHAASERLKLLRLCGGQVSRLATQMGNPRGFRSPPADIALRRRVYG